MRLGKLEQVEADGAEDGRSRRTPERWALVRNFRVGAKAFGGRASKAVWYTIIPEPLSSGAVTPACARKALLKSAGCVLSLIHI